MLNALGNKQLSVYECSQSTDQKLFSEFLAKLLQEKEGKQVG